MCLTEKKACAWISSKRSNKWKERSLFVFQRWHLNQALEDWFWFQPPFLFPVALESYFWANLCRCPAISVPAWCADKWTKTRLQLQLSPQPHNVSSENKSLCEPKTCRSSPKIGHLLTKLSGKGESKTETVGFLFSFCVKRPTPQKKRLAPEKSAIPLAAQSAKLNHGLVLSVCVCWRLRKMYRKWSVFEACTFSVCLSFRCVRASVPQQMTAFVSNCNLFICGKLPAKRFLFRMGSLRHLLVCLMAAKFGFQIFDGCCFPTHHHSQIPPRNEWWGTFRGEELDCCLFTRYFLTNVSNGNKSWHFFISRKGCVQSTFLGESRFVAFVVLGE